MISAQPRVSVLFPDAVGAAGEVCAGQQPKPSAGWEGWKGASG